MLCMKGIGAVTCRLSHLPVFFVCEKLVGRRRAVQGVGMDTPLCILEWTQRWWVLGFDPFHWDQFFEVGTLLPFGKKTFQVESTWHLLDWNTTGSSGLDWWNNFPNSTSGILKNYQLNLSKWINLLGECLNKSCPRWPISFTGGLELETKTLTKTLAIAMYEDDTQLCELFKCFNPQTRFGWIMWLSKSLPPSKNIFVQSKGIAMFHKTTIVS